MEGPEVKLEGSPSGINELGTNIGGDDEEHMHSQNEIDRPRTFVTYRMDSCEGWN